MTNRFIILKYTFFFLIVLCTLNSGAQNKLDSLLLVLTKVQKEDKAKLKLLNEIADEYKFVNIPKGIETADKAIALAQQINDQPGLAEAYLVKGKIYITQGNLKGASDFIGQSLTLFQKTDSKKGMAASLHSLGSINADLSKNEEALEYYEKAKALNEGIRNKQGIAANLNGMGNVYKSRSDYPKALELCKNALHLYEEVGEKRGMGTCLVNIGSIYLQLSDLLSALNNFQNALRLFEQTGNARGMASCYGNIGLIYSNQKDYSRALEYHKKQLTIAAKIGIKDTSVPLMVIASDYASLNKNNEAEKYYLMSGKIAEAYGNKDMLPTLFNNIGFFYYQQGDYLKAWDYYKKSVSLGEELKNKGWVALVTLSMGELVRDAPDSFLIQIGINPKDRFTATLEYLNKGKQGAIEAGSLVNQRFAWEDLSIAYEKQNDYAKSLDAYKNYIILRDSILNNEKEKKISHLNMQYEFDKKSDSIKLQEQLTDQKLQQQILLAKQQQQQLELGRQQIALGQQQLALTNKEKDIQQLAYLKTQADLQNEQLQKKEKQKLLIIAEKEKKIQLADAKKSAYSNTIRLYALLSFLAVLILIAIMLWRNNVHKQNANVLLLQQKKETDTQKEKVEHTLEELKTTQSQLIQREKMASLGELTAGIAHEIQNPLNFVNNFSEVNTELIEEMEEEISKGNLEEIKLIVRDIKQNMEKINLHGRRADGIVKGMLQHSQSNTGKRELTDINRLADEYLRLSYHGLRAKDKSFNATMKTDFDTSIEKINIVHQDIGRVLLNLLNNAFYSVTEKKKQLQNGFDPTVWLSTKLVCLPKDDKQKWVEIRIIDNGMGIPQKTLEKIYQPFFTTKPSGQGTGLGLSLSYDIITKANGGTINAETKEGEFAEFIIHLPANSESKTSAN